jgi:hypothetical protein
MALVEEATLLGLALCQKYRRTVLPPEARDLAGTPRVLFGALGMSLNRLAALVHSDPGTVSRYLSVSVPQRKADPPARLRETLDDLYRQASNLKEQLNLAQRRAAGAEDRCRELERRLDAAGARLPDEAQPAVAHWPAAGALQIGLPSRRPSHLLSQRDQRSRPTCLAVCPRKTLACSSDPVAASKAGRSGSSDDGNGGCVSRVLSKLPATRHVAVIEYSVTVSTDEASG